MSASQLKGKIVPRFHRKPVRRLLAMALVIAAFGIAAAIYAAGDRIEVVSVATLPYWIVAYLLSLSLGGLFEGRDDALDEYQIGLRNRAYRRAFDVALVLLVVAVVAALVLQMTLPGIFAVAAFAFLTAIMTPRLLVVWNSEDVDDSD